MQTSLLDDVLITTLANMSATFRWNSVNVLNDPFSIPVFNRFKSMGCRTGWEEEEEVA